MNGERFDSLSRRIADVANVRETRRTLFQALGLGSLSLAHEGTRATASPARRARKVPGRFQAAVDPLIGELAFRLDYDTAKIVSFVADEVRYEPYAGALRGPIGTLWASAGNSVDKAQLLAALLEASATRTRLVVTAADAVELKAAHDRTKNRPVPAPITDSFGYLIDPEGVTPVPDPDSTPGSAVAAFETFRQELLTEAANRISTDSGRITSALADAGVRMASDAFIIPELEADQHVRVQIASGTDWVDVALTGTSEASTPVSGDSANATILEAIPDDWFHTVTLRVLHEEVRSGSLETITSLEHTVRSQDLATADIALTHMTGADKNAFGFDLGGLLGGTESYYATVVIGEELLSADAPMIFGGQGGILDVFDEVGDEAVADGEPIAEWFEIEIRSPGFEPIVSRRSVFDRVADQRLAAEIDLVTVKPVELTELGGDERSYLPLSVLHSFAVTTGSIPTGYTLLPARRDSILTAFSTAARGSQAARQAIVGNSDASDRAGFIHRPSLMRYVFAPAVETTGVQESLRLSADIVSESRMGETGTAETPFGILAGVTSQIAEETALDPRLFEFLASVGVDGTRPSEYGHSVGAIVDRASDAGIPLVVLDAPAALETYSAALNPQASQLINAHLDAGNVIVLPSEFTDDAVGWWVYDPRTGKLFDQLADGSGGAMMLVEMSEYALKLTAWIQVRAPYLLVGECVAAIASAINDYLGGDKWGALAGAIQNYGVCK